MLHAGGELKASEATDTAGWEVAGRMAIGRLWQQIAGHRPFHPSVLLTVSGLAGLFLA